jgi:homospermidine synthase
MKGVAEIELSQIAKRMFADMNVPNDEKRVILTKLIQKISVKNGIVSVKYTKLAQAIAQKSILTRGILGNA